MKAWVFPAYFVCAIFSISVWGDASPSAIKMAAAKAEIFQNHKDIIDTKSMQRLKGVNQLGCVAYFGMGARSFNRFDHCVGVAALTAAFSTTQDPALRQKEIVAALIHDVAHGAFSHGSERWGCNHEEDGDKHPRADLEKVLQKKGYTLKALNPEHFPILDQPLPYMCADRIDYNIRKGLHMGILTQAQGDYILDHLHFDGQKWFFDAAEPALLYGRLAIHFTKNLYTSSWNIVFYHYFGEIVRYLLDHKKLGFGMLVHGTDAQVLKVIYANQSIPFIQKRLGACKSIYDAYQIVAPTEKFDLHVTAKFRGIMPLVQREDKELVFLNDLKVGDAKLQAQIQAYGVEYENVRQQCTTGWYIKLKIPLMDTREKTCQYRH